MSIHYSYRVYVAQAKTAVAMSARQPIGSGLMALLKGCMRLALLNAFVCLHRYTTARSALESTANFVICNMILQLRCQ